MKLQAEFSEPTKSEFRGRRNTKSKDRHLEHEDQMVDGNIKKYHKHDLDYIADFEEMADIDPSFNWAKVK